MTERTRGSQLTGSNQEAIDLNDLHASKASEAIRSESSQSANTDLASASIQSISVVRLSARPEKRKITTPSLSASEEPSKAHEQKRASTPRHRQNERLGILKNPYYKYEGNILERCISLVANLMKVLEVALLKGFKPQPLPTPPNVTIVKPKRRGPDGREIEEERVGEPPSPERKQKPEGLDHHKQ